MEEVIDIHLRHKNEKKELNAQIQALKHKIPKGDKKQKKQVNGEIALLTAQLEERHAKELAEHNDLNGGETSDQKLESLH